MPTPKAITMTKKIWSFTQTTDMRRVNGVEVGRGGGNYLNERGVDGEQATTEVCFQGHLLIPMVLGVE